MDTTTLKSQINELLTTVEDERFLRSITAMLQAYVAEAPLVLSEEEKLAIDEGEQDVQAGRTLSHQKVKQNTQARYPHLKPKAWK